MTLIYTLEYEDQGYRCKEAYLTREKASEVAHVLYKTFGISTKIVSLVLINP